jgi:uncharacterized protein
MRMPWHNALLWTQEDNVEDDLPDRAEPPPAAPGAELMSPPRVDSVAFSRKRESIRGRLELSSLTRLLSAGVAPGGTLEWAVEGSVGRDLLQRQREYLRVRTTFSPWMTCSRCLEPVLVPALHTDSRFRFAASEQQAAAEDRQAEDEDEEEVIAASPHLDLAALVEDEAILALPMAPVHPSCEWNSTAGSDPEDDV